MRAIHTSRHIAKVQYKNRGFLQPRSLVRAGIQLALMFLATFILLIQLDRSIEYGPFQGVGSSYTTFSPSYTDEPVLEETQSVVKPAPGRNLRSRPLFGFIPIYVAVMSLAILLIVFSGFIVLFLYSTGQLR